MNVEQAIARSISQNEIVHLDWSHDVQTDLIIACDDWTDAGSVFEFWGTSDDSEWRIHLRTVDAEEDQIETTQLAQDEFDEARADYDVCS